MMSNQPHEMPIEPHLDLHTFRPQDLGDLIPDYLEACRAKGIASSRPRSRNLRMNRS